MSSSSSDPSRAILPIPDEHQPYPGLVTYDAKDPATSFPPIRQLRPPQGAPNVLIVLIDDAGFAASSAFGGVIETPTADRLAACWAALQPVPHDGAVLADASGAC